MGLDYDKIKEKSEEGNFWVSYSDLFMVLSIVFLLMFVLASLRNGAQGIIQGIENKQLTKRAQELEEQIKVYEALKDEQLTETSQNEQEVYKKLMGKLTLLQDEARNEKVDLRRKAKENEDKEFALNEYQQVIRNIINANVLAKGQITHRDQVIKAKNDTLSEKETVIQGLNTEIEQKQNIITKNESKIDLINTELDHKIKALKTEQKNSSLSAEKMKQKIASLKTQSVEKISQLESQNALVRSTLQESQSNLDHAQKQLVETSSNLAATQQEKSSLQKELEGNKSGYLKQMADLQGKFSTDMENERSAFNKALRESQLGAFEKSKRLDEFQAESRKKEAELAGKLGALHQRVSDTEGQLARAQAEKGRAIASLDSVKKEKDSISNDLQSAKAKLNAQRDLAKQIQANFKKAGIPAEVNAETGDVVLAFGDDYFGTGSADLTSAMQQTLNKFIPTYSKSLFTDPKTAGKIANVEIVGFASSTYHGKFVNPNSLKPEDQKAVNFNLQLSFNRANAIFKHIFDTKKLQYAHQKDLLPLVKVVGRGYLPEGKSGSDIPANISEKDFCAKYNCNKAQRVIIKFNLKDDIQGG